MKIKKHYKLIVGAILIFISGLLIGGGVALFGAATFLALKKKKR